MNRHEFPNSRVLFQSLIEILSSIPFGVIIYQILIRLNISRSGENPQITEE